MACYIRLPRFPRESIITQLSDRQRQRSELESVSEFCHSHTKFPLRFYFRATRVTTLGIKQKNFRPGVSSGTRAFARDLERRELGEVAIKTAGKARAFARKLRAPRARENSTSSRDAGERTRCKLGRQDDYPEDVTTGKGWVRALLLRSRDSAES